MYVEGMLVYGKHKVNLELASWEHVSKKTIISLASLSSFFYLAKTAMQFR